MEATLHGYNTGHYFSPTARVYGWVITIFAVFAILNGSLAAIILLPAGVLIQLIQRRIEIDLESRTYKVGIRMLGVTFGKQRPLSGVDFLYLNKNNHTRVAESRASTMRFRSIKYDGYLKLADDTKLHLVQENSKEKALQRMEQISEDLGIELRDQTDRKFY
jgi:hypothetical protein